MLVHIGIRNNPWLMSILILSISLYSSLLIIPANAIADVFPLGGVSGKTDLNFRLRRVALRYGLKTTKKQNLDIFKEASSTDYPRGGSSSATYATKENESSYDLSYDAEKVKQKKNINKVQRNQNENIVQTYWTRQRKLSQLASRQKKAITFCRRATLGLIFTGASFETLATQMPKNDNKASLVAIIGGFSIAAVPFIQKNFLSKEKMKHWTQCRAVSEDLKREIYMYRAGIAPYDSNDAAEELAYRCKEVSKDIDQMQLLRIPHDNKGIDPPPKLDWNSYIELRAKKCRDWLYKDAIENENMSRLCQNFKTGFICASSIIGFLTGTNIQNKVPNIFPNTLGTFAGKVGIWGSVMTTMVGAIGTHIESWKFDELSMESMKAKEEIEELIFFERDFKTLVLECEGIIEKKNRNWVSKRIGKKKKTQSKKSATQWNPDIICGNESSGYFPASERVKWLIKNKDFTESDARKKVMKEYPTLFMSS